MIKLQFILDCITTVLTAVLCFLMLFHKYEVKKDHLIVRIAVIGCLIVIKIGVLWLHMAPFNLFFYFFNDNSCSGCFRGISCFKFLS